jgi:cyanuric acid amidohydrolase
MAWNCAVHRFPMAGPDDTSGLEKLFDSGALKADEVICIIAKTEGNGRVNDFSRPLAHRAFRDIIAERTGHTPRAIDQKIAFVMSGGCEGIISPHATVFARRSTSPRNDKCKRLTFAMANTRELLPEELGTMTQVELVAAAVREAVRDAGIAELSDVDYVQVKCPLLTTERINAAKARGHKTVTEDTLRSMGFSNGSSALGIAVGLGELDRVRPEDICANADLFTTRGAASSGIELMNCQVFVFGNAADAVSDCVSGHHRLDDMIDAEGVRQALRNAGIAVSGSVEPGTARGLSPSSAKLRSPSMAFCAAGARRCSPTLTSILGLRAPCLGRCLPQSPASPRSMPRPAGATIKAPLGVA